MDLLDKIIGNIEEHDVEEITACFALGLSPNILFNDQPLIYELTSEYARTSRFKDCVKTFVDHGLKFDDPALLFVLLDDAKGLENYLRQNPATLNKRHTLRCAYTPLLEATLLHVCAEFNHVSCAKVLVSHGADINARAGIDEHGFGGQSPIFHTVNQNSNNSAGMLDYLISLSADLKLTVTGLIWGKGYPWETFIPAVNPISYAMMGLLPQFHRSEKTISEVVSRLLQKAFGINFKAGNVPNKYLRQ